MACLDSQRGAEAVSVDNGVKNGRNKRIGGSRTGPLSSAILQLF